MDKFIWSKKETLSLEFCNSTIYKFNRDHRRYVGVVGMDRNVELDIKRSSDLMISNLDGWENEDKIFYKSLTECHQEYLNYMQNFNPRGGEGLVYSSERFDTGYQIQKTCPGEFYIWHSDECQTQYSTRRLTFIWYLNSILGEGGETEFYDGTKIKPEAGMILFFPATWNYIHRGISPVFETKYICTGWLSQKNNFT
jgi:Rps23 Pro-64 3,4-dihydroxylase Tpa1-like proline 4-hydroxylase